MPGPAQPRWGWHRLAEDEAARLVAAAGVRPGDLVLDLGAGDGAITAPLVAAGARVVAVELHPRRADGLRRRFRGAPVKVVQADLGDLRLPRRPFSVVANPPFALTAAVLRRLLHPGSRLVRADLVVPAHVAARWAAGRGSATGPWWLRHSAEVLRRLPPSAFLPPPPHPTAVLAFRPVARR